MPSDLTIALRRLGLGTWTIARTPRSEPYLGGCWHLERRIEVREDLEGSVLRETLAHELGHALAGFMAAHGPDFERSLRRAAHVLRVDWRRCRGAYASL